MTQRERVATGVGGIGFAVLFVIGMILAKTPGGTYKVSDMADYMAKGHHTAVAVASMVGLLSVLGLIMLLAGLRERVGGGPLLSNVFSVTSALSVAGFAIGWMAWLAVPMALMIGGSAVVVDPRIAYVVMQVGGVIVFGVGGVFLGVSLIALTLGSRETLVPWVRWFTLVVGVLGLASMAWLPAFALILWSLVMGAWLVVSGKNRAGVAGNS